MAEIVITLRDAPTPTDPAHKVFSIYYRAEPTDDKSSPTPAGLLAHQLEGILMHVAERK